MLKVGLTGGIGSGKTTVANIFRLFGIPVFVADLQARELLSRDAAVRELVTELLGPSAYLESGDPDRAFIANQVFSDASLLNQLNAIIHPAVRTAFDKWHQDLTNQPYVIQEAAILFESGGAEFMHVNILVWAPEDVRIQRVMRRDHLSAAEIRRRVEHQLPDDEKATKADFILINDGAHSLIRQAIEIHAILLSLAQSGTSRTGTEWAGKSLAS